MGVNVSTSSAANDRLRQAKGWLEARSPAEEILILAGTGDAGNELVRDLVHAKGAAFGWHRLSLAQLAAVLAAPVLATRNVVALGSLGVQAICARVVHKLAAESALGRYSEIASGPGFSRAFSRVVTELRLAGVDSDAVRTVAPDLKPLFEAYEANLADGRFTDWAGVLAAATEALMADNITHRLVGLPTLLLDVAVTNEAELSFVRALSARTTELLVLAPAADEQTLVRIREALRLKVDDVDHSKNSGGLPGLGTDGSLMRLQERLFAGWSKNDNKGAPAEADARVVFSSDYRRYIFFCVQVVVAASHTPLAATQSASVFAIVEFSRGAAPAFCSSSQA